MITIIMIITIKMIWKSRKVVLIVVQFIHRRRRRRRKECKAWSQSLILLRVSCHFFPAQRGSKDE